MFGNNTFGGFNANSQQPQQQQQPAGLFGAAPSTTTPFNAFGQQAAPAPFTQQPQPTGFGNNAFGSQTPSNPFGATPAPTHNVFAQPQNQPSNIFGGSSQPQPSTNPTFGGFGAAPANTFGTFVANTNPTNTTSAPFGQKPAAPTAPFGTTTPAFGTNVFNQNTGTAFGAAGPSAPPNGTANPPYTPVTLAENESTPSQKSTFNSIVAMDAYKNFSFEELRFQDYLQGRKTAVSTNTLGTGFGAQQQPQTGAFGSFGNNNTQVGAFGQQQQQQQPQTNLFGGAPTTNTFGAQPAANRNIFGQPATNNPSSFNQPQAPTTSGAFGAAAAPASNAFGGTNTLFGGNNATNPSPFGAQAAKPNIFGTTSTQPAFGTSAAAPSGGIFGQTPTQPQNNIFGSANNQTSGGGLFGNNNNTSAPQTTGGLFGTNNNQNNAPKPGGLFGASPNTGSSLFGQQAQPANTTNTFGFGQNNQQQPTGSLFGNNNQQQGNTGGTLFGMNNNQPTQTGTSGGLFGTNNTGNTIGNTGLGLFGGSNANNTAASGGLFGQKPSNATGSLFENKDATSQNNNNALGGSNLFGSSQAGINFGFGNNTNPNANSMFGSTNNSQMLQNQMGNQNGLFQSQQNQQPVLQARVDQDAYGNNPLFANHGISAGSRPAIPIRKQLPTIDFKPLPRPNTKITKLRGFARSVSPTKTGNSGNAMAASTVSNGSSVISRSSAYSREEPLLSPKAFIVKSSPKKLTIDPSTLSTLFRNRSTTLNGSPSGTPPPPTNNTAENRTQSIFDPDAEASAQTEFSKAPQVSNRKSSNHMLDPTNSTKSAGKSHINQKDPPNSSALNQTTPVENDNSDNRALMEDEVVVRPKSQAKAGEYWTLPSIDELRVMKRKDLKSIPGFKAGRVGYGQIEFQENVDLSGIEDLSVGLCGEIIVFKQSICSVYPDDPVDKPPVGKGLNVPAVITLENCWAFDKATRMPIKDPEHARVKLFMKRLKKSEDTDFIEYDAPSGKWTFSVKHFTTYGIDNSEVGSDDEDDEDSEELDTESYTDSETNGDLSRLDDGGVSRVKSLRQPASDTDTLSGDHENDGPPREMLFEEHEDGLPGQGDLSHANQVDERFDHESTASVTGSDGVEPTLNTRPISKKRPRQGTDPDTDADNDKSKQALNNAGWRNQIGLESRKVAVMQASLFARPESVQTQPKPKPNAPSRAMMAYPHDPRSRARISRDSPLQIPPHEQTRKNFNDPTNIPSKSLAQVPPVKKNSDALVRQRCPLYIPLSKSLAFSTKASMKNFSLSMARSFRVSFIGQSNQVIHPACGEIGNMLGTSNLPHRNFGDLAVSTVTRNSFELPTEIESAERLLEVQLKHTSVHLEAGIPTVVTNSNLRFRHFLASYDKADRSNNAIIWGLCSALFDKLKLSVPQGASPEFIERIKQIRREDAFSKWLEKTVTPSVEQDVRSLSRQQGRFSSIFKLLTGNKVERACELAIEMGNYRLATLIAQCRRSDATFKSDLAKQNIAWRQLRTDAHIDRDLRKTYELISGNATVSKGSGKKGLHVDYSDDINISEGLDWKRTLGLHLWFSASHDNFWSAVKTYEDSFEIERCAPPPVPWYMDPSNPNNTDSVLNRWKLDPAQPTYDAVFQIVKMFVDPTCSLESVLEPRGFGPSPFDYLMPWHLYILISRVMRLRDFEDRELILTNFETDSIDDDQTVLEKSGSVLADILTSQFCDQLVNLGLLKWAAFVLLHLENPASRAKAIEELLFRNIRSVSGDVEEFFIKTLKIPSPWIHLARAQVAHYDGKYFEEHRLLMESSKIHEAHKIAILELAPEAILRGDLKLIRKLFCGQNCNDDSSLEFTGGAKILMDFVKVMEGLQFLHPSNSTLTAMRKRNPLATQINDPHKKEEIEEMLQAKVSNLIQEIPLVFSEFSNHNGMTIKQQVCVNEMMSNLINLIESNPATSLRPTTYQTKITRNNHHHQGTSQQLTEKSKNYLNNHQNLINIKNLKISDQVLFIQNFSHKNFLKFLHQVSDNSSTIHPSPIPV